MPSTRSRCQIERTGETQGLVRATAASRVELDGGRRRGGRLGVQALKLWVAMKEREVRVAARPHSILGACFPGFAQGIHGLRRSFQKAVHASRVVENRSLVGAQGDGQVESSPLDSMAALPTWLESSQASSDTAFHSLRRARIGSSVAARRAGMTAARKAATTSAAVVSNRMRGS